MDNLEPITRNEMFLNGDDLEPITREEMILAGADLEPITRHEWFLKKYRGGGGGGGYDLVNIPNLPADIASFNDGTDLPMASLKVAVTPYQDLHGYDAPWAGGSGKNKLQTTATSQTVNGVTFTVNSDGTIKATGKATANVWFVIDATNWGSYSTLANKGFNSSLILNGCPSGGSGITYALGMRSGNSSNLLDAGNGVTITDLDTNTYYPAILIYNGYEIPSGGLLFKPMLRLSTVTDSTFAPYSNICPIIGWDDAVVTVADDAESPTTSHEYTIDLDGTRYGGVVDATNGGGTMDRDSVNLNSIDAFSSDAVNENGYIRYNCGIVGKAHNFNILCDKIKVIQSTVQANANEELISGNANNNKLYFTIDSTKLSGDLSTSTGRSNALKTYLATNDIQVVYELATPITVQLAPTPVKSLEGTNNISANCGQITEVKYFKKA